MAVPPQHTPPLLSLQAPDVLLQGEQAAVAVTVAAGRHCISRAVLTARALHIDSQQQLGLVHVDGGSLATSQEQAADASSGCRLALGDVAAGQQAAAVLLLDARYAGAVEVSAELQVRGGGGGGGGGWTAGEWSAADLRQT